MWRSRHLRTAIAQTSAKKPCRAKRKAVNAPQLPSSIDGAGVREGASDVDGRVGDGVICTLTAAIYGQ
ncbi:hypothetical protein [Corynebacterium glyciniphilum]|uniref:hypothetical protein n=1 Tax=Corynebacterium glyciniphilum TaxID=1404244 RepID=UPI003DA1B2C7